MLHKSNLEYILYRTPQTVCLFVPGLFIGEATWAPKLRELAKFSQGSDISWAKTQSHALAQALEEQGLLLQQKRHVLLSSGVQLCSQETIQQAIANHLKYFQLRGENTVDYIYQYPNIVFIVWNTVVNNISVCY